MRGGLSPPGPSAPGYPDFLGVEVTSECNLRCALCARTAGRVLSGRHPARMTEEVWQRVAEAGARVGKVCPNGFGEDFVDPGFLGRLEELDRLGVETSLSTNGTLVTPADAERLGRLRRLVSVNVSLDSGDPEAYRRLRGVDAGAARRGAAALSLEPLLAGRVTASAIVCGETLPGLAPLPALLAELSIRALVLQRYVGPAADPSPFGPRPDTRVAAAVAALRRECARLGIGVLVVPYLASLVEGTRPQIWGRRVEAHLRDEEAAWGRVPLTRQCGAPWEAAVVDAEGRVFPCCVALDRGEERGSGEAVVGDLREARFEEVWRGERFRRFRQLLLDGDLPAVCRACPVTSTGPHFFHLYAAVLRRAEETGPSSVRLVVENAGTATWTARTRLRIGTTRPRDRSSALAGPGWLSPSRTGSFSEESVAPGEAATFGFRVPEGADLSAEPLQLLAEEVCWLPGTEFVLRRREGRLEPWPLSRGREDAA